MGNYENIDASTKKYLDEIHKLDLIDVDQELEYIKAFQDENNIEARNKLIMANLRFAKNEAIKFGANGVSVEDLFHEASIGMMEAASRFDRTRGFKFYSYAAWWIRKSILENRAKYAKLVPEAKNVSVNSKKIEKAQIKGIEIDEEFLRKNKISDEQLALAENRVRIMSIDAEIPGNSDKSSKRFVDRMEDKNTVSPDANLISESLRLDIKDLLDEVNEKTREVIKLYHGFDGMTPHTFEDIAERLGLAKETVRSKYIKGIKKLRKNKSIDSMREYLN